MRKLRLDVDELRVETFATARERGKSGSVLGNMDFEIDASDNPCTGGGGSDPNSGYQTCPPTLKWSCNSDCDFCTVIVDCHTQTTYCC